MLQFEVILYMTWFSPYHIILNCNAKTETIAIQDKLEWEGVYKAKTLKIISFVGARRL